MAKAAYPTIGIAAFVMFGTVYFIGCLQRNKLFPYLCCIKYILDIISPNNSFHQNLKALIADGGRLLSLKEMGFPDNWNYLGVWKGV